MKRNIRISTLKMMGPGILAMAFFLMHGCGYKFVGGGQLPAGVKTVAVVMFENKTGETGLESTMTNYMNYEFTRNGVKVTSNQDRADAVLTGIIKSAKVETVSYRGDDVTVENRVVVVMSARMKNREGVELWAVDNMTERETYKADTDNTRVVTNKKSALSALCKKMAENFYGRMTEDF